MLLLTNMKSNYSNIIQRNHIGVTWQVEPRSITLVVMAKPCSGLSYANRLPPAQALNYNLKKLAGYTQGRKTGLRTEKEQASQLGRINYRDGQ